MKYQVTTAVEIAPTIFRVLLTPQDQPLLYQAGQYIKIHVSDQLVLPYSIACAPRADHILELFIRRIPEEADNTAIFSLLQKDAVLNITGPFGHCVYHTDANLPIIFAAAGVGIAQVKAIIEQAIQEKDQRPMHLFWVMPSEGDFFLYKEVEQWQQQLSLSVSRITRLGDGLIEDAIIDTYPELYDYQAYISGAWLMVDTVMKRMYRHGLEQTHCYSDRLE